jgi:hypothetical protein
MQSSSLPTQGPYVSQKASTEALVDRWAQEYSERTGRELYAVEANGFTHIYDIDGGRVVCVSGRSSSPKGPRDRVRQRGSPPPSRGDHRGHLIAHSMGGGMDINLFDQNAHLNLSHSWKSIERYAAEHPGTPIAIHLKYRDDSDRPSEIHYARVDPERGLVVDRFANPRARESDRTVDTATRQSRSDRRTVDKRESDRRGNARGRP